MQNQIVINNVINNYATVRGGNQPNRLLIESTLVLQLPKWFSFSETVRTDCDLYISMNDASQATQLGMALYEYQYGDWTGKTQDGKFIITNKLGETYKVSYSPEIKGTAREMRDGALVDVVIRYRKAIVNRWNGSAWSAPIKLSNNVDRAVNSGRLAKVTAENWITILARLVCKMEVVAGSGTYNALVLEGFRKQSWQRMGGEWWNFPKKIDSLCKRTEGGWVYETHKAGKSVALPVTMDRTTESKLLEAIAVGTAHLSSSDIREIEEHLWPDHFVEA